MLINNLTPIEVYYYSHNPEAAIELVFGMNYEDFPEINWQRIRGAWKSLYFLDDSGRSTAKTYDFMMVGLAKCALLKDRRMNLFAIDRDRGIEIADDFITPWLQVDSNFKKAIKKVRNASEPRLIRGQSITKLPFKNLSLFKTYTPALRDQGKKTRSDRSNSLIMNEWTSWPVGSIDIMEETIEPITTRTNWFYNGTLRLRIATEKSVGISLGRISNELLLEINRSKSNYQPRNWLLKNKPDQSFGQMRERFLKNFRRVWGFDYSEGINDKRLNFPLIDSIDDIVSFFDDYLDGDSNIQNQIIYDSSAQRPSDDCYKFVEYVWKRIEDKDPRYNHFNCGVDDIPDEFDGIILNSSIINKARERMLTEDFDRVYGGKWKEGTSHKPFKKEDIAACRQNEEVKLLLERDSDDSIFFLALDAAQGTESLVKGKKREILRGEGSDAAGCVLKFGRGTRDNPHEICHIYIANDVRSDPMALDVHDLHVNFGFDRIVLDPGGGGKELAMVLEKRKIEQDSEMVELVPIVPTDYQLDDGLFPPMQRILVFISRGTEEITTVYKKSYKLPPFQDDGELKNAIIRRAQSLIKKCGVLFPPELTKRQLIALRNHGKITEEEMIAHANFEEAIGQMLNIKYEMDKKTGDRVKTSRGHFKYKFPKRADLAMVIVYAIFIADVYVRWASLAKESITEDYAMAMG